MLWVDEKYRNQNIGSKIIEFIDEVAQKEKCKFIHLDTFDFQAKDFYLKKGFSVIGTIPQWVHGQDLHFMRKVIEN